MHTVEQVESVKEVGARIPEGIAVVGLDPTKTYKLCSICGLMFDEYYLNSNLENDTAFCENNACVKAFYAQTKTS